MDGKNWRLHLSRNQKFSNPADVSIGGRTSKARRHLQELFCTRKLIEQKKNTEFEIFRLTRASASTRGIQARYENQLKVKKLKKALPDSAESTRYNAKQ